MADYYPYRWEDGEYARNGYDDWNDPYDDDDCDDENHMTEEERCEQEVRETEYRKELEKKRQDEKRLAAEKVTQKTGIRENLCAKLSPTELEWVAARKQKLAVLKDEKSKLKNLQDDYKSSQKDLDMIDSGRVRPPENWYNECEVYGGGPAPVWRYINRDYWHDEHKATGHKIEQTRKRVRDMVTSLAEEKSEWLKARSAEDYDVMFK